MSWSLIISILLCLAALVWAVVLARRLRDWRVGSLAVLVTVILGHQIYAWVAGGYQEATSASYGILRSALTLITIYFFDRVFAERDQALWALRQSEEEYAAESQQAEVMRETLRQELEAKNEELKRFTYTVSHDLKSPLVTLHGFLGLLKQDIAAGHGERVGRDLERIESAAKTMQRLLEDLLELSRIGRMFNSPEKIRLTRAAQEAADRVAGRLVESGAKVEIAEDMPEIVADRRRILQVLQNLIDNAAKFMGDGIDPTIEIGASEDGDEIVCYVRDNGIGIAPEFHEKIFGLFSRLDKSCDGTGIGLALVERIMSVHAGRVWVESEGEGYGSTFFFAMPSESRHPSRASS